MASKDRKGKGRGLTKSQITELVLEDESDDDLFGGLTGDEEESDNEYEDNDLRGRGGESDLDELDESQNEETIDNSARDCESVANTSWTRYSFRS